MESPYQPFINVPPLDLAKLRDDLRGLARMRAIEGEDPKVGTRQRAKAIRDAVADYVLYVQVPAEHQSLDHVLHCIVDACRTLALSEPEQWRELGKYRPGPSANDIDGIADRLTEVAGLQNADSDDAATIANGNVGNNPRSKTIDDTPDDPLLTHIELAKRYQLTREAARKRLDRWRSANDAGWIEANDTRPNEPKYLYRLSAVRNLFDASKSASGETSA